MSEQRLRARPVLTISNLFRRRLPDLALFVATLAELIALVLLTPSLTIVDDVYIVQHLVVLGIALTRPPPAAQDRSLAAALAVAVSLTYPYAEVICLRMVPGDEGWFEGGLALVALAAALSLASLLSIGRHFGLRPALRGLTTSGPYHLVRHPMYLAYVLGDIGYNLQEWNAGTVLITMLGWASLIYRVHAEERVLAGDLAWHSYVGTVRYRLLPGVW